MIHIWTFLGILELPPSNCALLSHSLIITVSQYILIDFKFLFSNYPNFKQSCHSSFQFFIPVGTEDHSEVFYKFPSGKIKKERKKFYNILTEI